MKVVINRCYGGFGLSNKAYEALIKMGWKVTELNEKGDSKNPNADICKHIGASYGDYSLNAHRNDDKIRAHPDLIEVVEKLGKDANGRFSELKVVKIPDGVKFTIEEYDGIEWISEHHKTWA